MHSSHGPASAATHSLSWRHVGLAVNRLPAASGKHMTPGCHREMPPEVAGHRVAQGDRGPRLQNVSHLITIPLFPDHCLGTVSLCSQMFQNLIRMINKFRAHETPPKNTNRDPLLCGVNVEPLFQ